MPDPRHIMTDANRYCYRLDRYFELLRFGNMSSEKAKNRTKEIDGNLNQDRIIHEIAVRKDYNVFHEIFKLNKKDINKQMVYRTEMGNKNWVEFKKLIKEMAARHKATRALEEIINH